MYSLFQDVDADERKIMYKRDITVGCKGRNHNAVADSCEHGGMEYFGLTKFG